MTEQHGAAFVNLPNDVLQSFVELGSIFGWAAAFKGRLFEAADQLVKVVVPRLDEAQALQKAGFHGPAVVSASTAIELILELAIVRPFVLPGFLTDDIAQIFVGLIINSPGREQRRMVKQIAKLINVDLDQITTPDGTSLWSYVTRDLPRKRNEIVHDGATATEIEGDRAVRAAEQLLQSLALPMLQDAVGTASLSSATAMIIRRKLEPYSSENAGLTARDDETLPT